VALVATLFAFVPAASEPTKLAARLSWSRAPGADACMTTSELERDVSQRLGRDPFAAAAGLLIEGTVAHDGHRWIAKLWVRDSAGTLIGSRELTSEADNCESLGRAVGLAIALSIDPEAASAASASSVPAASAASSVTKTVSSVPRSKAPKPMP